MGFNPSLKVVFLVAAFGLAPATQAHAFEPPEGSEQYELLMPHIDFITTMRREGLGFSCCSLRDGRGDMEQIETGDPEFPYILRLTHTLIHGYKLSEPVELKIPAKVIIDAQDTNKHCGPKRLKDEAQGKVSTCIAPDFNVIWAFDNVRSPTYKSGSDRDGATRIVDQNGETVIVADTYALTNLYCYYPTPSLL